MSASNLLGEYLRACREKVTPDDVGITTLGHRRVTGLRREEVALLAGISPDYYLRLEQGRERHPSAQVLRALARVLCPDQTATQHLLHLGTADPYAEDPGEQGPARVPVSIDRLLEALDLPAFVQDRYFGVLAANPAARALSPTLTPGRNRLLATFLDPDERALFVDWDDVVEEIVGAFRASVAHDADGARTRALVARLSPQSATFRELWARHHVENRVDRPPVWLDHPVVGRLLLTRDNLAVDGPEGLRLVIYHAEPGTPSAAALRRLGAADDEET